MTEEFDYEEILTNQMAVSKFPERYDQAIGSLRPIPASEALERLVARGVIISRTGKSLLEDRVVQHRREYALKTSYYYLPARYIEWAKEPAQDDDAE